MNLKHLVKQKINEPMPTFPKSPIAARQVFILTGIFKQESSCMKSLNENVIIKQLLVFSNRK